MDMCTLLKSKSTDDIDKFLNEAINKPTHITTDLGTEFNSNLMYKWFEDHKVNLYYVNKSEYETSNATSVVDRFIKTIKEKLEVYQELNESKLIISAIKEIVDGYNNTIHTAIKKSPLKWIYHIAQKDYSPSPL